MPSCFRSVLVRRQLLSRHSFIQFQYLNTHRALGYCGRRAFGFSSRSMDSKSSVKPRKRLIVACDGTWLDSDNGFKRDSYLPFSTSGNLAVPSNVTRIVRALNPITSDDIPQITYYQAGIGSANNWFNHYWGGTTGAGISEHVREAYAFIAENYVKGDEIFFLGFSRGAFTARSIAGFIATVGLLTRRGMDSFYPIFMDWENQVKPNYKSQWPTLPFPNKPNIRDPSYFKRLASLELALPKIPAIKAVGVWETVGALGVPQVLWPHPMDYSFTDNEVATNVEYAFQALALDEQRSPYQPTVWEQPKTPNRLKKLKQTWFSGSHTNVGGGYPDAGNANITLAWMISQLDGLLDFDPTYIDYLHDRQIEYFASNKKPLRLWAMGDLVDSQAGIRVLAGSKTRTPGQYNKIDPHTGRPTKPEILLGNTDEMIHSSVRVRLASKGNGVGEHGIYDPKALKGFELEYIESNGIPSEEARADPETEGFRWILGHGEDRSKIVLGEDSLGDIEKRLYQASTTTGPVVRGAEEMNNSRPGP